MSTHTGLGNTGMKYEMGGPILTMLTRKSQNNAELQRFKTRFLE